MERLNVDKVGLAMGLFLSVVYSLCVAFGLLFPGMAMHSVWARLLPGFVWLTPGSFLLGLIESFLYGVFFAIIFVPIYNFLGVVFAERRHHGSAIRPGDDGR